MLKHVKLLCVGLVCAAGLSGCLSYANVKHEPKPVKDKALLVDMIAFAGVEAFAFTSPSDRTFYVGYSVGGVMLLMDLITSCMEDGCQTPW